MPPVRIEILSCSTSLRLVERGRRIALVVLDEHLDLPAGDLAADLGEVELVAVHHVLADLREGAGERREESDLDRRRLRGCADGRGQRRGECQQDDRGDEANAVHEWSSLRFSGAGP